MIQSVPSPLCCLRVSQGSDARPLYRAAHALPVRYSAMQAQHDWCAIALPDCSCTARLVPFLEAVSQPIHELVMGTRARLLAVRPAGRRCGLPLLPRGRR